MCIRSSNRVHCAFECVASGSVCGVWCARDRISRTHTHTKTNCLPVHNLGGKVNKAIYYYYYFGLGFGAAVAHVRDSFICWSEIIITRLGRCTATAHTHITFAVFRLKIRKFFFRLFAINLYIFLLRSIFMRFFFSARCGGIS